MSDTNSIADLPGPPALPLLGNTLQLLRASRVHLVGERWVERYGPMVRVKIPGATMVLVADLEAINEILRDRPDGYRRWASQREVIEEMGPNGVFSSEGDDWKRQRRLVLSALNIHYLSRYFDVVRTCTERLRGASPRRPVARRSKSAKSSAPSPSTSPRRWRSGTTSTRWSVATTSCRGTCTG